MINFLLDVFKANASSEAVVWLGQPLTYGQLLERMAFWRNQIRDRHLSPGAVVVLESDFTPDSVALFLVLIESSVILVPLAPASAAKRSESIEIAAPNLEIIFEAGGNVRWVEHSPAQRHDYYKQLESRRAPGLVLFSSGSSGRMKAAVHDLSKILEKFKTPRQTLRTISFLLYDHIGGVNTMLYTLSNGGCLITVPDRQPSTVIDAIERHKVELLPTSPTFLNLLLVSGLWKGRDLSSLKTVTYGTEPMPEETLKRFHALFPAVRLQQTYGLSELGILRSKSKDSNSLWVKIGGEGFETKVVEGILHIKAQSAMLGYLNAPSPFSADGWLNTGDAVQVEGEYFKILGRQSEMINVGGEKVYPAEVEGILKIAENVLDATVYGEKNPLMGNIVCAKVNLLSAEPKPAAIARIKSFAAQHLQKYKVPVKIEIVDEPLHSERMKKMRSGTTGT